MIVKSRNRDTAWFSMLDDEWPARRAAFEQWLEPGNFDAEGPAETAAGKFTPFARGLIEPAPQRRGVRRASGRSNVSIKLNF